ncbi:MAG: hypothetical protein IT317_01980 [Anaerolineales bacterium]|nr:hypothetical protein [Anaerolineales bacterium]
MVSSTQFNNPERTAWTVLLSAFTVFMLSAGGIIFGGRWWLRNADQPQMLGIISTGTVLVRRPNRDAPEVNLTSFPVGSSVSTVANAQASVTFTAPDGQNVLATLRIFGNTSVEITEASSPRFATGVHPHTIVIHVASGRVRATVGVDVDRPVRVEIISDPGAVTVLDQPGSNATVEATFTESMITVREGVALVTAEGQTVALGKDQRAEVAPGAAPNGPLAAEQNLVRNGDFVLPDDGTWQVLLAAPAVASEQPGQVDFPLIGGRRVVRLARTGNDWGRVSVTQELNRDVQGYTSLRLNLDIILVTQDVKTCGAQGTECPLMVKINYVDVGGGQREWLKGFYYLYDPNFGYPYCVPCSPRFPHEQWPQAQWQPFSSENLLDIFAAQGTPAAQIQSITIYAEGHTFTSMAADVQLLANE